MPSSFTYAEATRAQQKMTFLYLLIGALPSSLGKKLRQLLYRPIFGRMGSNVAIEQNVVFIYPAAIELGNGVILRRCVTLNCWDPNGRLILREDVHLDQGIHVQTLGGTIEIGPHTYLGPYVCMAGPGNIHIGRDCLIASGSGLYANNHNFDDPTRPINQQAVTTYGITIEDDCWLGSGVRVLDGVTIGKGSVIGAGAVVTKDIPPYSVAVGVPAKVISKRGIKQEKNPAHQEISGQQIIV